MAGLVPAIHDVLARQKDVDARDKRGHDQVFPVIARSAKRDEAIHGAAQQSARLHGLLRFARNDGEAACAALGPRLRGDERVGKQRAV
jgi:hypothetical protein